MGADTPLTIPSIAPGLPLSPERTRGVFWDFQGPFGVMGSQLPNSAWCTRATCTSIRNQIKPEHLGKIAVTTRYHASLNPGAIYRKPFTMEEYLNSRILSDPVRLLDCVPMVNGGLAYIVTSVETAKKAHRQAHLPARLRRGQQLLPRLAQSAGHHLHGIRAVRPGSLQDGRRAAPGHRRVRAV